MIQMAKASETVKFKNYTRKIKATFMVYVEFESTLISENNGKPNPDESIRINIKAMLTGVIVTN